MVSKSFIAYACLLCLTTSINAQSVTSGAKAKGGHAHTHKHHHAQHHARDAVDGRDFQLPNSHEGLGLHFPAPLPGALELRDLEALADRSHGHHRKHKSHPSSSTGHAHAGRGLESFAEGELGKGEKFDGEELHNLMRRYRISLQNLVGNGGGGAGSRPLARSAEVHRPHRHKHKSSSHSSTSRPHVERGFESFAENELDKGEEFFGGEVHNLLRRLETHLPHHHKHKSHDPSPTSRPHVERDLQAVVNEVNSLANGEKFVGSHLFARSPKAHRPHHHKHKSSSASSTSHAHVGRGVESVAELGPAEKFDGEELHNLLRRLAIHFGESQPFPVYTPGEIQAVGYRDLSSKVHRPHHHKHKSSSASSTSHSHVGRGLESEELHNLLRRLEVPFGEGQPFPVYTPGEIHAVGFRRGLNSRNCKFFWPALIYEQDVLMICRSM